MSHIRHRLLWVLFCASLVLNACTQREIFDLVPDTGHRAERNGTWPSLVPSSQFQERRQHNAIAVEESAAQSEELESRVARLRRRAARLRGPILSNSERSELRTALKVE